MADSVCALSSHLISPTRKRKYREGGAGKKAKYLKGKQKHNEALVTFNSVLLLSGQMQRFEKRFDASEQAALNHV